MSNKRYLGDGIYIEQDSYGLKVTTENGISVSNTIYFDEKSIQNFLNYLDDIKSGDINAE